MRLFVDTSSLFKKYIPEAGSENFQRILDDADEIAVSPITWIELISAIERAKINGYLSVHHAEELVAEARQDFAYFHIVQWNKNLEERILIILRKHSLKSLDLIQLGSGVLSEAKLFVTSDKRLYGEAKKIMNQALFV